MQNKYDLVIFDLDGTITKSEGGVISSAKYSLNELNYPLVPDEELKKMIGPPLSYSMSAIWNVEKKDEEKAKEIFRDHFMNEGYRDYAVYSGIRNMLLTLKNNKIKLAIATSKPYKATKRLLEYFALDSFFDKVCAIRDDKNEVSKKEIISNALQIKHTNAVMIGDRSFDCEGAKLNNIDFIGAAYGYGTVQELHECGAEKIAYSPLDITKMLTNKLSANKGKFITIEGIDGCGKTTQIKKLEQNLIKFGFDCIFTREPGGCKIAEDIREIILSPQNTDMSAICEALLYAASRAQHVQNKISPALSSGINVICDRFVDSSIAYQGAARELGTEKVKAINDFAVNGVLPEKTIFLSIDASESIARRKNVGNLDRLEIEKSVFYEKAYDEYNRIIKSDKERFILINAKNDIDTVAKDIFYAVTKTLEPFSNWEDANK